MSAETHPSRTARRVARWPVHWLRSRSRSRQSAARLAKARRERIALVSTPMPDGPPVAPISLVRAAVAAGDRILLGLAHEGTQISLEPKKWQRSLKGQEFDLLLIEVNDGGVPGWGKSGKA